MTVERGGSEMTLTLTPDGKKVKGQLVGFVGLSPQLVPLPDEYRTLLQYGPLQALWHGVQKTWSLITLTFDMIGKLIGGIVSLDNLSGPISIAKGPAAAPITGWSISSDSWRSSASTWGSSTCSPAGARWWPSGLFPHRGDHRQAGIGKIQEVGFRIGAAILMLLMGIALFNDFARL